MAKEQLRKRILKEMVKPSIAPKEDLVKDLRTMTKRLDAIEKRVLSRQFFQELLGSLTDFETCANCGKPVMAKGKFNNCKVSWHRKGFYQCGDFRGRLASWCSKKCDKQYKGKLKLLNAGR